MYQALLIAHGIAGGLGMIGAVGAIGTRLMRSPHKWHVWSGRVFTLGMVGVGLTGLLITSKYPSLFLLGLAVFVLYLAGMGWLYARARGGLDRPWHRVLAFGFTATFSAMLGYGLWAWLGQGAAMGIVLAVFGGIGLLNAVGDLRTSMGRPLSPKERIAAHLSRMLGGTIAAVTAFLLVQMQTNSLLVWLGPTVVITPLIAYWSRKVRGGWLPRSPVRGKASPT